MHLTNIDASIRWHAVAECDADVHADRWFRSRALTPAGLARWPRLLREALAAHDVDWLARRILREELLAAPGSVPEGAAPHALLAASEFNHYAMRGVCLAALGAACDQLEVYCARGCATHDEATARLLQGGVCPRELLEELRTNRLRARVPCTPGACLSVRPPGSVRRTDAHGGASQARARRSG